VPSAAQLAEAAAVRGVRVIPTQLPLDWTAAVPESLHAAADALAELAAAFDVASVHLHTPALVDDVRWSMPVVAVAHSCVGTWWRVVRGGTLPRDLAWRARCVAKGLARADAVIAPTRSFAAMLHNAYRIDREIGVVYNGRRTWRIGAVGRKRAVLTAGRLWDEGKGVAVLDQAAAQLDAPVYAAGPTAGPHGVAARFANLQLLGVLASPRLAALYASIPLFAAPCRYEPFGLAVLEAAQAGMALVLSDIPTFRELWSGAAQFVDPGDPRGLALELRRLLDDVEECARLGAAARERAREYTADAMVEATLAVHRAVLAIPAAVA
jgi:glycosyltransferase involved in cell wall biosynthesis